jgi:photosystem II stability/assembly factor-like uncharacterized protein
MRKTVFLLSGLIISTLLFSQHNYYWQNPLPQGANLLGVYFINPLTGWMAGDAGVVLHTIDGGNTWEFQNSGINNHEIYFRDENNGWVVGSGAIRHTTDGGQTWTAQNCPTLADLYSISFINADTGWIFGSYQTVLRTYNGGQHWDLLCSGSPTSYSYNQGVFLSYTNGWAAGRDFLGFSYGRICHSTDGGLTWQEDVTTSKNLNSLSFPDQDTGYVCGDNGLFLKTMNGGVSWDSATITPYASSLQYMCFSNPHTGFALTEPNGLYNLIRTLDGGLTWTTYNLGSYFTDNQKIACTGDSTAYIAGYNGSMFKTVNFNDWQELCQGSQENLTDICFPDAMQGWSTGPNLGSSLLHTVNGGQTWEIVPISFNSPFIYRVVSFYNDAEGIVGGDGGPIIKTSDGGNHWDTISIPPCSVLTKAGYFDRLHPVIAGWGGKILYSSDGGNNWDAYSSAKPTNFEGLCIIDPIHAYAVGDNVPQVVFTADAGATWNEVTTGTSEEFHSVFFLNSQEGWIGCNNGDVIHTTNAGQTWDTHSIQNANNILAIHFFDPMNGEAMNTNSRFFTYDGGVTWSSEDFPYNRTIATAYYQDPHIAWFVGGGGTILLSSDFATPVTEKKKTEAFLRIYPDPANDQINLRTDLQSITFPAVFTISDLMGRVVKRIDIPTPSGLNNVDNDLKDGVYIGSLRPSTGNDLKSKFMVLRK